MLQKIDETFSRKALEIERSNNTSMNLTSKDILVVKKLQLKPSPRNENFPTFTGIFNSDELKLHSRKDKT